MKTLLVCSSLFLTTSLAPAQDAKAWTRFTGSSNDDYAYSVAIDGSGNIVLSGATQGSISGGNAGRYDLFVAKYNAAGVRLWIRQRGSSEREFAYGITTDSAGDIYTTGYTGGGLDGNRAAGNFDVFLTKFDAAGNWMWTRQFGFANDDEGRAVATDSAGNIYVTGYVRGALDGLPRPGTADIFIRKYDSAGNKLWSALFGSAEVDEGCGIACDASGNVFVTGWCSGSIDGVTPHRGNGDNFVAKYSSSGQQLWVKQWGTVNKDTGYAVAADGFGNVYVSGYTAGSLYETGQGNRDYFLAKFNSSGTFQWGKQDGTSGHDQAWGLAAAADGNVYVTGETGGSLNGGTFTGILDIFLSKYTPGGVRSWTIQYGTADDDVGKDAALGGDGNVYCVGYTGANLDGLANPGPFEPFLTKFVPPSSVTPQPPVPKPATLVSSNAFNANWNASVGALGYRLDVATDSGFATYVPGYQNLVAGNVTRQVAGLVPTTTYYYRVRAYNTNGTSGNSTTISVTLSPTTPCTVLTNANFESGFAPAGMGNGWTAWGKSTVFDDTLVVHNGDHSQRVQVSGTGPASGGVYQQFPAMGGYSYSISAWIFAGDQESYCSLGVDPAGGADPGSAAVVWSTPTTYAGWAQRSWTGAATANRLTVFFKVASADGALRTGYLDDLSPSASMDTPSLACQMSGGVLTLRWPQCPPSRLEQASYLGPLSWAPAATHPVIGGGWKTVTLIPSAGQAFYRLARE